MFLRHTVHTSVLPVISLGSIIHIGLSRPFFLLQFSFFQTESEARTPQYYFLIPPSTSQLMVSCSASLNIVFYSSYKLNFLLKLGLTKGRIIILSWLLQCKNTWRSSAFPTHRWSFVPWNIFCIMFCIT